MSEANTSGQSDDWMVGSMEGEEGVNRKRGRLLEQWEEDKSDDE